MKNAVCRGLTTVVLITAVTLGAPLSAMAEALTITGVDDEATFNHPRSGVTTPVIIDDDVQITGDNLPGGSLIVRPDISIPNSDIDINSDADPTAYNAISREGDAVYLGQGGSKARIGTVDEVSNGKNGRPLQVHFWSYIPNGNFEERDPNPDADQYNGLLERKLKSWTQNNDRISVPGDAQVKDPSYKTQIVGVGEWLASSMVPRGSRYGEAGVNGFILPLQSEGVIHGAGLTSEAFTGRQGDKLSLFFRASALFLGTATGSSSDFYIYLKDTNSGARQLVKYLRSESTHSYVPGAGEGTGGSLPSGWIYLGTPINLPSSSSYVVEIVAGVHQKANEPIISTGWVDIDAVSVAHSIVDQRVVTLVARRIAQTKVTAHPARPDTRDRNYTFEIRPAGDMTRNNHANGKMMGKATMHVHTWPAKPVLDLAAVPSDTHILQFATPGGIVSEQAEVADVYLDGSIYKDNQPYTTSNGFAVGGMETNSQHTIKVITQNDMGDSDPTEIKKYTSVNPPTFTQVSVLGANASVTISNNGNPAGIQYTLERAEIGSSSWSKVRDIVTDGNASLLEVVSGLSGDKIYQLRIRGFNGDQIPTVWSTAGLQAGPPAPTPITAQAPAGAEQGGQLQVGWGASVGASAYEVFAGAGNVVSDVGNVTTALVTGQAVNVEKEIFLVAKNAYNGRSDISEKQWKYTSAAIPTLSVAGGGNDSITLSIGKNGNPPGTVYALEQSQDGVLWTPLDEVSLEAGAELTQNYTDSGLSGGQAYRYRIKALNGNSIPTAYSSEVIGFTAPGQPQVPVIAVVGTDTDKLTVVWSAVQGASGYNLYGKKSSDGAYTLLLDNTENLRFETSGLLTNTSYSYYVVARNTSGVSLPSAVATGYTNATVPRLGVSNVVDTNNLTIFPEGNPAGTQYQVEFTTDAVDDPEVVSTWQVLDDWNGTNTPQHSGVAGTSKYTYRCRARNGDGLVAEYSNLVSARANVKPAMTVTSPEGSVMRSSKPGFNTLTLSGTLRDANSDVVTINATVGAIAMSANVEATPEEVPWSLTFDVSTLAQGNYSSVTIAYNDQLQDGSGSVVWGYLLTIDNTAPTTPTVTADSNWTKAASVPVTITSGTDAGAGVARTEYRLSGATVADWQEYSAGFAITAAGTTTIFARTTDNVGNVSLIGTRLVKIDRTAPVGAGTFTAGPKDAESGKPGYTNDTVIKLQGIGATDSGGSGNGAENAAIPKEMQISNRDDFKNNAGTDDVSWDTYVAGEKSWIIEDRLGQHTIYIRYRDAVGNVSATQTASIIFDNSPIKLNISAPTAYMAKTGETVSYTLSFDRDDYTLTGVNANDKSKVELVYNGNKIREIDKVAINNAVTIVNVDADVAHDVPLSRIINILIPAGIRSEGTIGIRILASAADDGIGNESPATVGNASFRFDALTPDWQNQLFAADLTVVGGAKVNLLHPSNEHTDGLDSDSLRFAPAGYAQEAANSTTITSTHGSSKVINAPTVNGDYYLYIVDAAGNMSVASTHKLTVKNVGPAVSIVSGPSTTPVRAGSTVSYVVEYAADATGRIVLNKKHVTLTTTGTANAYVAVAADDDDNPLRRKITLSNLMGEGTVKIKLMEGTATDAIGNPAVETGLSDAVVVDNTPAVVATNGLLSNNPGKATFGRKGDALTLAFTTNEMVVATNVTIAGIAVAATPQNAEKTSWQAQLTLPIDGTLDALDGTVAAFSIVTTDMAGNIATPYEGTANLPSQVTLDFTSPVITISGAKDVNGRYMDGATITCTSGAITVQFPGGTNRSVVSGFIAYDAGNYTVTAVDAAGNSSNQTFTVNYDAKILNLDYDALTIGYQSGDSADSITRNVTLAAVSISGGTVTWVSTPGAIASNGIVSRPASGAADAVVTLTATIDKNGITSTKIFAGQTVLAQAGADALQALRDDALAAKVYYVSGDSAVSVTDNITMTRVGTLHGSRFTWTASPAAIVVPETLDPVSGRFVGEIQRPAIGAADLAVVLTATLADPDDPAATLTRDFPMTIKALERNPYTAVQEVYDTVDIQLTPGDTSQAVTGEIQLISQIAAENIGTTVVWSSSNPSIINVASQTAGVVTRPTDSGRDVILTATISRGAGITQTKNFNLRVSKTTSGGGDVVSLDQAALAIGYYGTDNADRVTAHVTLPVRGANGSTITWESDAPARVSTQGIVTRPDVASGEQPAVLTATISKAGFTSLTKTFTLKVQPVVNDNVIAQIRGDVESLGLGYGLAEDADHVMSDLLLPTTGPNGCIITWVSSNPAVVSTSGTVTPLAIGSTPVTLTAKVSKASPTRGITLFALRTFTVTIMEATQSGTVNLDYDFDQIEIEYATGDTSSSVTQAMYFTPRGATGTQVTWVSDNSAYASNTGRVTRPAPDEADKWVTITATLTHPVTGETRQKVFEVKIVKLSDEESVKQAARELTIDEAFDFGENDTWESVTENFWMLRTGNYETSISWSSSNQSVVRIGSVGSDGKQEAEINRQEQNKNVILTATISKGGYSATKTYLLVVRKIGDEKTQTREDLGSNVTVTAGEAGDIFVVYNTELNDGTTIDYVNLDANSIEIISDNLGTDVPADKRMLTVSFGEGGAGENAVEIPAGAVYSLSERFAQLVIDTPAGQLRIPTAGMSSLSDTGTDLYFRLVPLAEGASETKELRSEALQRTGDADNARTLGLPWVIDTNYTGQTTYVTIPFGDDVPDPIVEANLKVYVRHSDGSTQLIGGTLIYRDGMPYGVEIPINKFSSFQIVDTTAPVDPPPGPDDPPPGPPGPGPGPSSDDADSIISVITDEWDDILIGTPEEFTAGLPGFDSYRTFLMEIPEGQRITTAVRVDLAGGMIHVPTEVIILNGKYYARIHALQPGTFALIWNPQEMNDVRGHWAQKAVNDMCSRLVVMGIGDNNFAPDRPVTRAEFAVFIVRALGLARGVGENPYPDVPDDAWYAPSVKTATAMGIISGFDDGLFRPQARISREQAMSMIARAMKLTGLKANLASGEAAMLLHSYTDGADTAAYAQGSAVTCLKTGVVSGRNEKTLAPKANLTRAETAGIIRRLLQNSGLIDREGLAAQAE